MSVEQRQVRVLHALARLSVGGINSMTLAKLRSKQVEHHVVVVTDHRLRLAEYEAEGVTPEWLGHTSWLMTPRTLLRAVRTVRRLRPDVIEVNFPLDALLFGIAARVTRVPLVMVVHTTQEKSRSWRAMVRLPLHTARIVVAVSEAGRDYCTTVLKVPAEKVQVVSAGVDTERFTPADDIAAARRAVDLPPDGPVLISVGRLERWKGTDAIISMVDEVRSAHPDVVLLVAGDGPDLEPMREQAEAAGISLNVRFLGNRTDVEALMRAADLFVSTSPRESFSMVATEAMASGLPVVGLDLPALAVASVDGPVGELVDTAAALPAVIDAYLADPDRLREEGKRARRAAENHFSLAVAAEAMDRIYATAAGRSDDAAP
jgi:glycosyltransferase involved in cell wall biosynthesis